MTIERDRQADIAPTGEVSRLVLAGVTPWAEPQTRLFEG
jgi:hypothetical protein